MRQYLGASSLVMHPIAGLVHDLYELRQAGKIDDAEAQWVLRIVLPEYNLSLPSLAAMLVRRERHAPIDSYSDDRDPFGGTTRIQAGLGYGPDVP
jgi:hypothetical protein